MRARQVAFSLSVALLAVCDPLTPAERRAIQRWLLCEECIEGERDSVVKIGSRAEKALGKALRGPPGEGVNTIRLQVEANWRQIRTPATSLPDYVKHYLDNYRALYQSRSAVALGLIATPRARQLLLDAVRRDSTYRDDVRRVLGAAFGILLDIQDPDWQSAPPNATLPINPAVLVRDSATNQPLEDIRVVFRVDSGGGSVGADSVRHTNPSGVASVQWRLGGSPGNNVLRAIAGGKVVRFHAAASTTPAPNAPTNLISSPAVLTDNGVTRSLSFSLSWTDGSTTEAGFYIERCAGPECTAFVVVGSVGANVTSFPTTAERPSSGTPATLNYRVRSYHSDGTATPVSSPSNTVMVMVP